jgi:hypothetical protein
MAEEIDLDGAGICQAKSFALKGGPMASWDETSKTLRVIGQLLEKRGIDVFELKCLDDEFSVLCGDPMPPHLNLVELRFSLAEIQAHDAQAKGNRQDTFKLVDFQSLPEILRTLGRHVDDLRGRVLRISNSESTVSHYSITLEYQTRDGQRHSEEFSTAAISDHALRMYKARTRPVNRASR